MAVEPVGWRRATADDDDAIVLLSDALHAEDPDQDPVPAASVRRTLAALRAEPSRGRAVVLDRDGDRAGYALLIAFWSNELGGDACIVDELYVAPRARGLGLGGALLQSLQDGSGPWPRTPAALLLEVTPGNRRAMALYERLGFRGHNRAMRWRRA